MPGLASHSLVSVVKLCNAGCQVDVRDISCEIRYKGKTIVQCSKDVSTGLWMMPLTNGIEKPTYDTQHNDKENISVPMEIIQVIEQRHRRLSQILIGHLLYRNGKRCKPKLHLKRERPTSFTNKEKCQTRTTTVNGEKCMVILRLVKRQPRLANW